MPSFQNPLGSCMPMRKRSASTTARRPRRSCIEDDIYGDLQFFDRRPKPLKAWDTEGL